MAYVTQKSNDLNHFINKSAKNKYMKLISITTDKFPDFFSIHTFIKNAVISTFFY
jgi:hypothetical protein